MKFLRKLDNNLLTAIIVGIATLIAFAVTSFLISTSLQDIPFGILLSGGILATTYVISSFLIKLDEGKDTWIGNLASIVLKFVVSVTSLLIFGLMYYRWNIKLFNIFTFVGVYTLGTIVFILLFVIKKDRKE